MLLKKSKHTSKELDALIEERDNLNIDHQDLIKKKINLDLTIKDLAEEISVYYKSKERADDELGTLLLVIHQKELELRNIMPSYQVYKMKEEEAARELALKEQKQKQLYAKLGRGNQFISKKARDRWIQTELKYVEN